MAVPCGFVQPPPPPPEETCPLTGAWIQVEEGPNPQQIPNGEVTQIEFDEAPAHLNFPPTEADLANNRIVIVEAGFYFVGFGITYGPAEEANAPIVTNVFLNGDLPPIIIGQVILSSTTDSVQASGGGFLLLFPGDELTLHSLHNACDPAPCTLDVVSAALSAYRITCLP